MIRIALKEFFSLARLSRIAVTEESYGRAAPKLEAVLSYSEQLAQEITVRPDATLLAERVAHEPRFAGRPDLCNQPDAKQFLALAPECVEDYFVVPVVVSQEYKK